jgi:hypothetical protein
MLGRLLAVITGEAWSERRVQAESQNFYLRAMSSRSLTDRAREDLEKDKERVLRSRSRA